MTRRMNCYDMQRRIPRKHIATNAAIGLGLNRSKEKKHICGHNAQQRRIRKWRP